ncbi:MAG: hypothetical protein OQK24_00675 [Magnetovibrio sp.]|nr:hypothetical protein [Magnetovibrio sp.]
MSLKTQPTPSSVSDMDGNDSAVASHNANKDLPLLGLFAVGFGVLSILPFVPGGFLFAPLSLILGLIALFIGQIGYGLGAVVLSMVGIMSSPILMGLIGVATFLSWLGALF